MSTKSTKKTARIRRAVRTRRKIRELYVPRLCVNRTSRHIYAQLISADGAKVIKSASTLQESVSSVCEHKSNISAAKVVGTTIAKMVLDAGIKKVAFDRSGFKFHGRVKALADAAREAGLEF